MTSDLLRRAAADMRAKAEAATPGPWRIGRHREGHIVGIDGEDGYSDVVHGGPVSCMRHCYGGTSTIDGDRLEADADHIASWHPAVALAVADWLDSVADWEGALDERCKCWRCDAIRGALAVARTFLGEQP